MIAYAITDPTTLHFNSLENDLKRFSDKSNIIVFRDKTNINYASDANSFLLEAKRHSFDKILLHTDYLLAHKLNADGVHLKSTQSDEIEKAKALGLFVVISTHTLEEAKIAQKKGADMITFSPIFMTPNKGKPKGIEVLEEVVSRLFIPVIALGGIITQEHILQCKESEAEGFASIRYFL